MKLIVTGATGFVGTEVIRQSLRMGQITSVVALARKPVTFEDGTDVSKLKSLVIKDYGEYPDEVKRELAGADACIWFVMFFPPANIHLRLSSAMKYELRNLTFYEPLPCGRRS
jgi:nucleoside-diphosphate-sugar epimerase